MIYRIFENIETIKAILSWIPPIILFIIVLIISQ